MHLLFVWVFHWGMDAHQCKFWSNSEIGRASTCDKTVNNNSDVHKISKYVWLEYNRILECRIVF